jgi:hypothetical protein
LINPKIFSSSAGPLRLPSTITYQSRLISDTDRSSKSVNH